jgi:uncharacterized protein YegJ (DUF2314 family)/tetratricopeptide (TPR) repeat protein
MIQVRCPDCGYVQTLSEERFLAIPHNYLNCPHCRAKVPKEWKSADRESIPDEARNKMLAFSRRILNGGEVSLDMVYALESLVRHYGPMDESVKALGVGYCRLGEIEKACEFLDEARKETPDDPDILESLLRIHLEEEEYDEAVHVGWALLNASERPEDDYVAALALALVGTGDVEEAGKLLDSRPDLDPGNPLVKEARREAGKMFGSGARSLLGLWEPISRVLRRVRPTEPRRSTRERSEDRPLETAESFELSPRRVRTSESTNMEAVSSGEGSINELPAVVEYWIYAPEGKVPEWRTIREMITAQGGDGEGEVFSPNTLESLVERRELTVDYLRREDSEELFNYPEDQLPRNSRELTESDRKILTDARMIARVRLNPAHRTGPDYLVFAIRVVEAIREITGGIVQDALSHTLWGTAEWNLRVADAPLEDIVGSHVGFEVLEEENGVWIHSHGMQKFGIPEVEMERVPTDLAASGLNLMIMVAETLVQCGLAGPVDFRSEMEIEDTPFLFMMEPTPGDDEGHFPLGSLKILPYVADYDPHSIDTLRHVLKMLATRLRRNRCAQRKPATSPEGSENDRDAAALRSETREHLLTAHTHARSELPTFKKSFSERPRSGDEIYAVKVGFPVREGAFEWMWVSLDAWRGKSLVGRLENTPVLRKDLQKGGRVQVEEGEIFDWVIAHRGAVVEGAFTESEIAATG